MKRFVFVLLALIIPTQPLSAAPTLAIDEALTTALENHPQIIEAKLNLNGAEARTGQALSNYYPQISIAADWNRGRSYLTALQGIKTTEVNSAALYLKQTLYDFGRTSGAVDAARSNRDVVDKSLIITRQDLTLRVRSAFHLLLAAEKQAVAVRETVAARAQVHQQALEFFNQGIRAKVDVARAEAIFFTAKTALIRAENNREIARMELANAMGTASLGELSLVEPSHVLLLPLPERSQAQQEAIRNRAELQQLSGLKSAASANLKTAKGSYMPILSGTASVGYADRDFPPTGNVWTVGLNLTMPLFSGFSSVEQVREANANISAIEARQNNLKLQIIKEVEFAWLGGNEAAARLVSTEKEVTAAAENKALAEGRYHEGVGSIIEVTDAQTQALDAQTAHIQALYDYYTTLARLDRAVGKDGEVPVKE
ncbi:MAG: TolC family protein [Verrucomicrobia bacterium]|nr:TolC family protein [Deltaproteobacteria bacterium]